MHVKLTSLREYANDLDEKIDLNLGAIETKKKDTRKKSFRTKVVIVHSIEDESKDADVLLSEIELLQQWYVSFKHETSDKYLSYTL